MAKVGILNNSMRAIWIICIWCLTALTTVAQQRSKVENIKGEWVVSNDITIIQARENALNEAKIEAIRQSGGSEFVSESNVMFRSEKKEQVKELFESLTTTEVSGEISEFTVVKEEKETIHRIALSFINYQFYL